MKYILTLYARECYAKKNQKISYDKESRVLSVEVKRAKSVDSDINGNVVIDYDKKGNIVRINLYNFDYNSFKSNFSLLKSFASKVDARVLVK